MANESNLLSTPDNYATQDQLSAVRQYAKALMYGDLQQPVHHWTQGLSNVVAALMGGRELRGAGESQRKQDFKDSSNLPTDPTDPGALTSTKLPFSGESADAPAGSSTKGQPASIRNNNPGAQWPGPIASEFGATGSQGISGNNRIATFDDPVNGGAALLALLDRRYTGMPLAQAIKKWSGGNDSRAYTAKIVSATGLSPDTVLTPELLRSPQGITLSKAMARHEAGQNYPMTDDQWGQAHTKAFNGGQQAQALPFSGEPADGSPPPQDGLSAITRALAGRGAIAPTTPVTAAPTAASRPTGEVDNTGQPIGPVPHRPSVTREQMEAIVASPRASPELKKFLMESYYGQRQPMGIPTTGGIINYDPTGKVAPKFVPTLEKGTIKGEGGIEMPGPYTFTPGKGTTIYPPQQDTTGQPAAPQGAKPPPARDDDGGVPNLLRFAPGGADATSGDKSPLAAVNDGAPGMLGTKPPSGDGAQLAQVTPKFFSDFQDEQNAKRIDREVKTEAGKKAADAFAKTYDTIGTSANLAQRGLSQLQLARTAIEDDDFYSGIGANAVLDFKRIQAGLGFKPNASAPNELFQKIMSGSIVEDMKIMLQGLGQVRVAEIQLLSQATANMYNSKPANRAVLDMLIKTHEQAATMGKLATDYAMGYRWDAKTGERYKAYNTATGLDYGFNAVRQKYLDAHPLFTGEQIKNYRNMFEKDPNYRGDRAAKINAAYEEAVGRGGKKGEWTPGSATLPPGVTPDKK